MLFNKKLINKLFFCDSSNLSAAIKKEYCEYGSIIVNYMIVLKGNKITSIDQCPIFFKRDKNNVVNLHPFVINFYHNLGLLHSKYFQLLSYTKDDKKVYNYKILYDPSLPYVNNKYIDPIYLENIITKMIEGTSIKNKEDYKDIFTPFVDFFKKKKKRIKKKAPEPVFIKTTNDKNEPIKLGDVILDLLEIVNLNIPNVPLNKYDRTFYLFENEMFNQFIASLILGIFHKNKLVSNFETQYNNYSRTKKMFMDKIAKLNENAYEYLSTYPEFDSNGVLKNPSEFMNIFVPLIDRSIYKNALYYDENNNIIEFKNPKDNILRIAYISGYKKNNPKYTNII